MDGKIVIAIDFGTTYSAIGYTHVKEGAEDKADAVAIKSQLEIATPLCPTKPSKFPFLDPSQLDKAQNLARLSTLAENYSNATIEEGVTRYLRVLLLDDRAKIEGDGSSIRLVSEPETAAIHTITTIPNCAMRIGDVFVVCDAGGGIVDLATYQIIALDPAIRVEEAAIGAGDLCGSAMLNSRFLELVERKTGPLDSEFRQDVDEEFKARRVFPT
ncbi:hypothetical protein G7Y89_g11756 [Cudoniella acicularis]|uniref:Uncharacterized protein n=1 Tax=Cudoniella acicularis TaxID=354080 RepID=A0A8H4RA94_9HELO|nr:hypothetical protein G7Y89_g11756 [Cudoniella acicularis]